MTRFGGGGCLWSPSNLLQELLLLTMTAGSHPVSSLVPSGPKPSTRGEVAVRGTGQAYFVWFLCFPCGVFAWGDVFCLFLFFG